MLGPEHSIGPARLLDAHRERLVFADLAPHRGVPAGGEIETPTDQQNLAVDRDLVRAGLVHRPQILHATDQHDTRRDDQPLPKAADFLQRVQRQHVNALIERGGKGRPEKIARRADIGVDKAQPFRVRLQRALPAGMRLSDPARRQIAGIDQPDARIVLRDLADRLRRAVLRAVIDDDDRQLVGQAPLRGQPGEAGVDIADLVTRRNEDRHRRQRFRAGRRRAERCVAMRPELPQQTQQQPADQTRPNRTGQQRRHLESPFRYGFLRRHFIICLERFTGGPRRRSIPCDGRAESVAAAMPPD